MPTSWKAEMFVQKEWTSNQQRFATEEEAKAAGSNLYGRWTLVDKYKATPTEDPVNTKWADGKSEPVDSPAAPEIAAQPDAAD